MNACRLHGSPKISGQTIGTSTAISPHRNRLPQLPSQNIDLMDDDIPFDTLIDNNHRTLNSPPITTIGTAIIEQMTTNNTPNRRHNIIKQHEIQTPLTNVNIQIN